MADVSRRGFLGSSGIALSGSAAASPQKPGSMPGFDGGSPEVVQLGSTSLPVLHDVDAVVVGGSFAGVACALQLARAGRRVLIVEPRTYLGREVTATLRPWIAAGTSLPSLVLACTGKQNPDQFPTGNYVPVREVEAPLPHTGEIPLKLDKVKLVLENLLLDAGVALLYASCPMGIAEEKGKFAGLIVGNKSGRQVLRCRMVVDTTETALIPRISGARFQSASRRSAEYRRTVEFDKVGEIATDAIAVDPALGLHGNIVKVHRGYRDAGHILIELAMVFEAPQFSPEAVMQREIEARFRTMKTVEWLVANVPAFGNGAWLAHTSYELQGPHTTPLRSERAEWSRNLGNIRPEGLSQVALSSFAAPMKGVWCLGDAAQLDDPERAWFFDPVLAAKVGDAFGTSLARIWNRCTAERVPAAVAAAGQVLALEVREPESPQKGKSFDRQAVSPSTIPVARKAGVLVAGGGTSGATAAASAAREGADTLLLEMNPGLGGTGTIGAVDSYWFGRRGVGFAKRVSAAVADVHRSVGYMPQNSATAKWNIEAKMFALLREARSAGAEVHLNTLVTGALVDGHRIRGAVLATRYGPRAVLSDAVIDATGDGDLAAHAGAEFVYGSAMDHYGMWCSFAQFTTPGRNSNHFTGAVDVSNIADYNRVILEGRRRGNNPHDHGVYVAPRETRHILGDVLITLTDQFRQRRWPDVVNIHYSNHDIKGKTTSQWLQSGLMPPHFETEIPYRALLPKAVDNLIVAGKAFSTNHDGSAGIRMQADLENLGGITGIAAALAVKERKTFRDLNVAELQQRLIAEGLLPPTVVTRKLRPARRSDAELAGLVQSMLSDQPLPEYQNMEMFEVFRGRIPFIEVCTAGRRIVPHLEAALNGPRRLVAAQALAIYGSKSAVPTLIEAISRSLEGGEVPARTRQIRFTQLPPDHGAMPDVCYLLYSLGMTRDKRSIPVWERVAEILKPKPEEFRDMMRSPFQYVDAVCFGAERLGDPAAVPALKKLHSYPALRDQVLRGGIEPDYLKERQAMCELSLAKALARCGSPDGLALMIDYLEDSRTLLSEQAHAQLVAITDRDAGKNVVAWRAWLEQAGGKHSPRPLLSDPDIEYDQEILIDSDAGTSGYQRI